jgi:CDP-diacylglycerol--serine O-phosphatidyltransferase
LLIVVGFLMVSTWRFYSFKDLNLRNRHPFQTLVLICGFLFLLVSFHRYMLFIIGISYMLSGVFTRLSYFFRRRPPESKPAYNEAPESR